VVAQICPELNDIERVWRDLKEHHLAHQTFADPSTLDRTVPQHRLGLIPSLPSAELQSCVLVGAAGLPHVKNSAMKRRSFGIIQANKR
jgi:hypothetical protein